MDSAGGGRRTLPILFVTTFPQTVASMVCMAPPIMAKEIGETLGLPSQLAGAYIGVLYTGVILASSGTAFLISRFGPLKTSLACVVIGGLALVLFAAGNTPVAVLATVIMGLSYGPLTPASSHVMREFRGSSGLGFLMSVRQTSVPLGGVLAGLLVPWLVLAIGWRGSCIALGLATACLGAAVALGTPMIREERPPQSRPERASLLAPLRFVLRQPPVLALSAMSLVFGAMQVVLSSFIVIYLIAVPELSLVTAGALLSISQIAGVGGRMAWGYIADRVTAPRRLLFLIGILIAIASVLTGLFSPRWPTAAIAAVVVLFGATASGWNGVFLAEIIREAKPGQAGLVTGGSLVFTYFGALIGPPLFAGIATLIGLADAFLAMAAIVVAGSMFTLHGGLTRRLSALRERR